MGVLVRAGPCHQFCFPAGIAEEVIARICHKEEQVDPEGTLSEIENVLCMVDSVFICSGARSRITEIRRRLVSLYDQWVLIQSHLPTCSVPATGISNVTIQHHLGRRGRPPLFVNVNMIEFLRGVGYTWEEVSEALLVSRSTI